jgi:pyrroline-5-carboxylate reductase
MSVAVVGAGNLGGAVAAGLLDAGAVAPSDLRLVTAHDATAAALAARLGVAAGTDVAAAVTGADVVLLGVKPAAVAGLLPAVGAALAPGAVVVGLAAGVRLAALAAGLPAGTPVVRVMTNTPVRIRAATSILCAGAGTPAAAVARVRVLFDALGTTHVLDEALMDVATALAGSGPAYLFLLVEALRDAGVALGLDADAALAMAATTVEGAARLLAGGVEDPAALRAAVTSPAGTTAAAIGVLEEAGLREAVRRALAAAVARAEELGA